MIGRLTGELVECTPERILLDVGGVGYSLRIPLSTYYEVVGSSEAVSLHVHTYVREDAIQLFGFSSPGERTSFEVLISISGIGPRIALAILSGIGTLELRQAVEARDRGRLQKIPGVGKKTAERLLLELRDRLKPSGKRRAGAGPEGGGADAGPADEELDREDAISALTNLGYSREVSDRAVGRAIESLEGRPTLEAILKTTLQRLSR